MGPRLRRQRLPHRRARHRRTGPGPYSPSPPPTGRPAARGLLLPLGHRRRPGPHHRSPRASPAPTGAPSRTPTAWPPHSWTRAVAGRPSRAPLPRTLGARECLLRLASHHPARTCAAFMRPGRCRAGDAVPAHPLPAPAPGDGRDGGIQAGHRSRPLRLHRRLPNRPRPAGMRGRSPRAGYRGDRPPGPVSPVARAAIPRQHPQGEVSHLALRGKEVRRPSYPALEERHRTVPVPPFRTLHAAQFLLAAIVYDDCPEHCAAGTGSRTSTGWSPRTRTPVLMTAEGQRSRFGGRLDEGLRNVEGPGGRHRPHHPAGAGAGATWSRGPGADARHRVQAP